MSLVQMLSLTATERPASAPWDGESLEEIVDDIRALIERFFSSILVEIVLNSRAVRGGRSFRRDMVKDRDNLALSPTTTTASRALITFLLISFNFLSLD